MEDIFSLVKGLFVDLNFLDLFKKSEYRDTNLKFFYAVVSTSNIPEVLPTMEDNVPIFPVVPDNDYSASLRANISSIHKHPDYLPWHFLLTCKGLRLQKLHRVYLQTAISTLLLQMDGLLIHISYLKSEYDRPLRMFLNFFVGFYSRSVFGVLDH